MKALLFAGAALCLPLAGVLVSTPVAAQPRATDKTKSASKTPRPRNPQDYARLLKRLRRPQSNTRRLESAHFTVTYDAARLSPARAQAALRLSEAGWARCDKLFVGERISAGKNSVLAHKIHLDLSPSFTGMTGITYSGGLRRTRVRTQPAARQTPKSKSAPAEKPKSAPRFVWRTTFEPARIAVRLAELDYLGLTTEFVLTHEIAHVFSGSAYNEPRGAGLADTSLGEGIADWAAGSFAGLEMRPWWGHALRDAGLWVEPDALFITGDFDDAGGANNSHIDFMGRRINARDHTARYAQSGLLVQYLVGRFGWRKFRAFAAAYSVQRGVLDSNDGRRKAARDQEALYDRILSRTAKSRRPKFQRPKARKVEPDGAVVRAVFQKYLGVPWEQIRAEWEAWLVRDPVPPALGARLVAARRIYAAVREYEASLSRPGQRIPDAQQARIRDAFLRCNRALNRGEAARAEQLLEQAQLLIKQSRPKLPERGPDKENAARKYLGASHGGIQVLNAPQLKRKTWPTNSRPTATTR